MKIKEPQILDKIMEGQIPIRVYENKFIKELDSIIATGSPTRAHDFLKRSVKHIDKILNLREVERSLIDIQSKNYQYTELISDDDERILRFLVSETKAPIQESIEILGSIIFLSEVLDDLGKTKDKIPDRILFVTLIWCYVNVYELCLYHIDRRASEYLRKTDISKLRTKKHISSAIDSLLKEKDGSDHGTAGQLNIVLSSILGINENNSSILGNSSKPKLIRNKISHSNLFYDSYKNTIKVSGGEEYTIKEFGEEFKKIFGFLVRWLTMGFFTGKQFAAKKGYDRKDVDKMVKQLRSESRTQMSQLAKLFLEINSMPERKVAYHRIIMGWRKKPKTQNQTLPSKPHQAAAQHTSPLFDALQVRCRAA